VEVDESESEEAVDDESELVLLSDDPESLELPSCWLLELLLVDRLEEDEESLSESPLDEVLLDNEESEPESVWSELESESDDELLSETPLLLLLLSSELEEEESLSPLALSLVRLNELDESDSSLLSEFDSEEDEEAEEAEEEETALRESPVGQKPGMGLFERDEPGVDCEEEELEVAGVPSTHPPSPTAPRAPFPTAVMIPRPHAPQPWTGCSQQVATQLVFPRHESCPEAAFRTSPFGHPK